MVGRQKVCSPGSGLSTVSELDDAMRRPAATLDRTAMSGSRSSARLKSAIARNWSCLGFAIRFGDVCELSRRDWEENPWRISDPSFEESVATAAVGQPKSIRHLLLQVFRSLMWGLVELY